MAFQCRIVHAIAGRTRLRVPALSRHTSLAAQMVSYLRHQPGWLRSPSLRLVAALWYRQILSVGPPMPSASSLRRSLLLRYRPTTRHAPYRRHPRLDPSPPGWP
jgi:hypothetical protein